MEYALRAGNEVTHQLEFRLSLNPCFNGICSASEYYIGRSNRRKVCLNPCFNGICSARREENLDKKINKYVLILVLMEYALRESAAGTILKARDSLNPCFNGICSARIENIEYPILSDGLNPCFNGICSAILSLMQDAAL